MNLGRGNPRPAPQQQRVAPEYVRDALAHVPANCDRELWVRIAMAIKSDLGDDGFEIWRAWSEQADTYNDSSARSTWRSIKAAGGVTLGTLISIAKEHGFTGSPGTARVQVSVLKRTQKQAEREAEEERYRNRANEAARLAERLWGAGEVGGDSAYLQLKGVRPHGVRFRSDGTVLVPMRNAAGELQNLQQIRPTKPAGDGPQKLFLRGGRTSALAHWLGQPQGAAVVLMAEGYATAASIFEATGLPCAVCFTANNLVHMAPAIREAFPHASVLVCGDDDRQSALTTGKNTGREKAASAARIVQRSGARAAVAIPEGLPEGGTDWNDLAAHLGSGSVKKQIEAAVLTLVNGESSQAKIPSESSVAPDDGDVRDSERDPFRVDDVGVWHVPRNSDGERGAPKWVCAPLRVVAITRDESDNGYGYLLEFENRDGNTRVWAAPSSMFNGEGAEWSANLRHMGLHVAPGVRARALLGQFIETRNPKERAICTDRVGWHGNAYVLPNRSIGVAEGERYVFQSEGSVEDTFRRKGALEEWQHAVARPCSGNSRLVLALCTAFAGPLLRLVQLDSGGINLRGASSKGKTTALRVAASVWGGPGFMQRWRATDNALEAIAVQHSDCVLILDELGQLDPRVAGECAYMLSNEQEKSRATRSGLARKRRTWRLLFLSSGEIGLADHMAEAGKRVRAGQEVRMVDVPLDAGKGMGGLEDLHAFSSPADLAESIVGAASRVYGVAGLQWIEWISSNFVEATRRATDLLERYRDEIVPVCAGEQVRRVGARFALLAAAGELATAAGVTGWHERETITCIQRCFNAWLDARGHYGNGEEAAMFRAVKAFLEKNGDALFTYTHRVQDDRRAATPLRAGFRRMVNSAGEPIKFDGAMEYLDARSTPESSERQDAATEFLVFPEAFKREVCKGFDPDAVATLLRDRGHLKHQKDRLTDRQRLPGHGKDKVPVYRILPSIFIDDFH